jgi:hypothetical protein
MNGATPASRAGFKRRSTSGSRRTR